MGFVTASHLAAYSSLVEVVSGALGGGKADQNVTEDLREAPPEIASARIAQLLSR